MRAASILPLVVLGALACKGSTGPIGPEGPQGPAGNANVVSGTFTVAPDAWTNDFWYITIGTGTQGNPAKVTTVMVPALTSSIVNTGAVLVYLRVPTAITGAPSQWSLLPLHQGGFGGGYLVALKSAVQAGQIRLGYLHEMTDLSATVPPVYNATPSAYEFRYVGIDGAPAAAVAGYARLGDPDLVLNALRADGWY